MRHVLRAESSEETPAVALWIWGQSQIYTKVTINTCNQEVLHDISLHTGTVFVVRDSVSGQGQR